MLSEAATSGGSPRRAFRRSLVMRRWFWTGLVAAAIAAHSEARAGEESRAVFLNRKQAVFDSLKALVRSATKNVLIRIFVVSDNDGTLFGAPDDQYPMAAEFAD